MVGASGRAQLSQVFVGKVSATVLVFFDGVKRVDALLRGSVRLSLELDSFSSTDKLPFRTRACFYLLRNSTAKKEIQF